MTQVINILNVVLIIFAIWFLAMALLPNNQDYKKRIKYNLEQARCNYILLDNARVNHLYETEYFNCREYWYNQVDSLTKLYNGR